MKLIIIYRRLWVVLPKGIIGWSLLLLAAFLTFESLREIPTPKGVLLALSFFAPIIMALVTIPLKALDIWDSLPFWLRGPVTAVVAYLAVITTASFPELYNFRLWKEFAFPSGMCPWTISNTAGFVAALAGAATQFYGRREILPAPVERVLRGPRLLSYQEARLRALLSTPPSLSKHTLMAGGDLSRN